MYISIYAICAEFLAQRKLDGSSKGTILINLEPLLFSSMIHTTSCTSLLSVLLISLSSLCRFDKMTEVETNTNPIDRTVAHLLFHRPLELSGKLPKTLESPASAKLPCERKATSLLSTPSGVWPENFETKETRSHLVSKTPVFSEGEKSKSSSRVNNLENALNCEAEHGATKAEAS